MRSRKLQLMISGKNLFDREIVVNIPHTSLLRTSYVNPDYAIIDLELSEGIVPGEYSLRIDNNIRIRLSIDIFHQETSSYNYGKNIITGKKDPLDKNSSIPLTSNSVKI